MASRPAGSRFRDELSEGLRALRLGAWRWCFDNIGAQQHRCPRCHQHLAASSSRRPGDLAAIYHGRGVLIEAKEIREEDRSLPFSRLEEHQRAALAAVTAAGGLALVCVRWCITRAPRAWAVTWPAWDHLERTLARKSIPLDDSRRPGALVELRRARLLADPGQGIPNPLVWDLRPVLEAPCSCQEAA